MRPNHQNTLWVYYIPVHMHQNNNIIFRPQYLYFWCLSSSDCPSTPISTWLQCHVLVISYVHDIMYDWGVQYMIPKLNILKEHRFKLVEDEHPGGLYKVVILYKWSSWKISCREICRRGWFYLLTFSPY